MKYIALAALIATAQAGTCKEGLEAKFFSDAKCKDSIDTPDGMTEKLEKKKVEEFNKCRKVGDKYEQMSCDSKAMTHTTFTDKKCKKADEDVDAKTFKYKECTKIADKTYIQLTGAAYLSAAAAATLAFVGSQF